MDSNEIENLKNELLLEKEKNRLLSLRINVIKNLSLFPKISKCGSGGCGLFYTIPHKVIDSIINTDVSEPLEISIPPKPQFMSRPIPHRYQVYPLPKKTNS